MMGKYYFVAAALVATITGLIHYFPVGALRK
jgi:hypothetical protein